MSHSGWSRNAAITTFVSESRTGVVYIVYYSYGEQPNLKVEGFELDNASTLDS